VRQPTGLPQRRAAGMRVRPAQAVQVWLFRDNFMGTRGSGDSASSRAQSTQSVYAVTRSCCLRVEVTTSEV
jgi:hypothetical protein